MIRPKPGAFAKAAPRATEPLMSIPCLHRIPDTPGASHAKGAGDSWPAS